MRRCWCQGNPRMHGNGERLLPLIKIRNDSPFSQPWGVGEEINLSTSQTGLCAAGSVARKNAHLHPRRCRGSVSHRRVGKRRPGREGLRVGPWQGIEASLVNARGRGRRAAA